MHDRPLPREPLPRAPGDVLLPMRRFLPLVLLLPAACGDDLPTGTSDAGATGAREVRGRAGLVRHHAGGEDRRPLDLNRSVIQAIVEDGGAWRVFPGAGTPDGDFVIEGVPGGPYWLRVDQPAASFEALDDNAYLWTDASDVDFTGVAWGRDDAPRARTAPTTIAVDAGGLAAWSAERDLLGVYIANLGFVNYFRGDVEGAVSGFPAAGATALAGLAIEWVTAVAGPLADAARGDEVQLLQVRFHDGPAGLVYATVERATTPTPFTLADGGTTALDLAFASPPALPFRLAWSLSAYEAHAADVGPGAGASAGRGLSIGAVPGAPALWSERALPLELFVVDPGFVEALAPGVDVDLGDFLLPLPVPASTLVVWHEVDFAVPIEIPDWFPAAPRARIGAYQRELPDAAHPLAPLVSPARAPRVDGADLFAGATGVALTPTLSWRPPAVGAATAYRVVLLEPGIGDALWDFVWRPAATLLVPGDVTSVRVPPDVLRPGFPYVVAVRAISQPGVDVRATPTRQALPYGYADCISAPFTTVGAAP
jgi:hypothetical protein